MAGINRLGRAPPKPGTLRPLDPNKYRAVDFFSEEGHQDVDFMRMVADVSDSLQIEMSQQQQNGWLFSRGAFDKGDLLYLRDQEERKRSSEEEMRDREKSQFAQLRAQFEQVRPRGSLLKGGHISKREMRLISKRSSSDALGPPLKGPIQASSLLVCDTGSGTPKKHKGHPPHHDFFSDSVPRIPVKSRLSDVQHALTQQPSVESSVSCVSEPTCEIASRVKPLLATAWQNPFGAQQYGGDGSDDEKDDVTNTDKEAASHHKLSPALLQAIKKGKGKGLVLPVEGGQTSFSLPDAAGLLDHFDTKDAVCVIQRTGCSGSQCSQPN